MDSSSPFHGEQQGLTILCPRHSQYFKVLIEVLLGFALLGSVTGCNPTSAGSTSSGSPPAASVVNANDLGTLPTNPDILGRDGAYSTKFQGYSVWVYGDTALAKPDASGRTFFSNTWSYTSDFDASNGITGFQERLDSVGSPSMLLDETPEEYTFNLEHYGDHCQVPPCGERWAIWPSSLITDPVTNHALVFYSVIHVQPNGDFQGVGSSVAIWQDVNDLPQRPTFSSPLVPGHPDLMIGQNEPSFGSASLIANGTLYLYGCSNRNGLDKPCRLAKVNPAMVQDRSTWMFYTGNGQWSSSDEDAVPVFDGLDILSVSWNGYLQQYIAVYTSLFSNNVMIRTSSNPEGPWSDEMLAFTAMGNADGSNIYDAQAHSEYDGNGGQTIYVTYSRSLQSGSEVRLVAVQLQKTSQH